MSVSVPSIISQSGNKASIMCKSRPCISHDSLGEKKTHFLMCVFSLLHGISSHSNEFEEEASFGTKRIFFFGFVLSEKGLHLRFDRRGREVSVPSG